MGVEEERVDRRATMEGSEANASLPGCVAFHCNGMRMPGWFRDGTMDGVVDWARGFPVFSSVNRNPMCMGRVGRWKDAPG